MTILVAVANNNVQTVQKIENSQEKLRGQFDPQYDGTPLPFLTGTGLCICLRGRLGCIRLSFSGTIGGSVTLSIVGGLDLKIRMAEAGLGL